MVSYPPVSLLKIYVTLHLNLLWLFDNFLKRSAVAQINIKLVLGKDTLREWYTLYSRRDQLYIAPE